MGTPKVFGTTPASDWSARAGGGLTTLAPMPDTTEVPDADGRSRRWDAHKAQRRREILDAAIEVIERDGLEISIKQIADRLALPRPVVYRHFEGRADLDERIRARIIEMLMAAVTPTLRPGGSLRQAVRHALATYLGWVEEHPRLHHFLGTGSKHERGVDSTAVSDAKTAIARHLVELVASSLAALELSTEFARPMGFGTLGFVDAAVNSWRSDPDSTLTARTLTEFLTVSVCHLIEGNARIIGVSVDADAPLDAAFRRVES